MIGLVILTTFFILGLVLLDSLANVKEIKDNWPKHRCKITIMPFASLYGHDPQENFNFCMQNSLQLEAGPLLTPVFTILATIMGSIGVLMSTLNSLRVGFATFMGGINLIFQNFTDRMVQLTYRLRSSAARMKSLMSRVYGTFFALMFAGVSGMQALNNFGNTFLFRFLNTFCFDPETRVEIEGKGSIPIQSVEIGDIFSRTQSKVIATFAFLGDGQAMVKLGETLVSTNHFVRSSEGSWIQASEHPDAVPAGVWKGGREKPLICLNTHDHQLPIGPHIFSDYDETEDADQITMKFIEKTVNAGEEGVGAGAVSTSTIPFTYSQCVSPTTRIRMRGGSLKAINEIGLGEHTQNGVVLGSVEKDITEVCTLPTGEKVGAGLLLFNSNTNHWVRAGALYPIEILSAPSRYRNLVLTPSAIVETEMGTAFRDYMELHSQEAEKYYDAALRST